MTHLTAHLNDDQFTECVLFAPDAVCQAHLNECAACQLELKTFTDSVTAFDRASRAWSESQPLASLRAVARSRARRAMYAPAGWALVTAALVAAMVPVWNHEHRSAPVANVATISVPADSASQIADDNQLMQSVNVALSENDPSPFREYRLDGGTGAHLRPQRGSKQ